MPGKILDPASTATATAQAGFFGKLPCTGDFVSRGLPRAFRTHWDGWVTRHLAGRLADGSFWPGDGLRFRARSGGQAAAGVIVPSTDSVGRSFPLSLVLIGVHLPGPGKLDPWCDAALVAAKPALGGIADADQLLDALDLLLVPQGTGNGTDPMLIWTTATCALGCGSADPDAALTKALTPPKPLALKTPPDHP